MDLSAVFNQSWIISKIYVAVFNFIFFSPYYFSVEDLYSIFTEICSCQHVSFHSEILEKGA